MSSTKANRSRGGGFTLIEVLVVVAIIALLIAILLPSLRKARDNAKQSLCLAHLHEFGSSFYQYAHDNKAFFPLQQYIGSTYDPCIACDDNLFVLAYNKKYVKNVDLYSCPGKDFRVRYPEKINLTPAAGGLMRFQLTTGGVAGRSDFEEHAQWADNPAPGFGTSYEYLGWSNCGDKITKVDWHPDWVGQPPVTGAPKTTNLGKPNPAFAILMHDADDGIENGRDIVGAPRGRPRNNYPEPWDNHGVMGMNMLFGDGHAVPIKRNDLKDPVTGDNRVWARNDCD